MKGGRIPKEKALNKSPSDHEITVKKEFVF
jgi:hypothetical protein